MLGLGLGLSKPTFAAGLLLDTYSGAAAAYSLRLLNSDYSGSAIRVRESSGNTEADIGFVGGELDTASLLAHCGANDGYVVTWYDQSGNSNDATQATAGSQPQIVSGGNVITKGSNPTIDFDGTDDLLRLTSNATNIDNVTAFVAFAADNNAQDATFLHYNVDSQNIIAIGLGDLGTNARMGHRYVYNGTIYTSGVDFATTDLSLVTTISTGGNSTQLYLNGSAGAQSYATRSGGNFADIGSGNTFEINGKISEVILYESDQSTNRTAIEANINDYYSIYP